jgi:hypothetical protein
VTPEWPELELLGQVNPPDPAVLDAAREVLWAVVAGEMLSHAGPGEAGESRRIPEREAGQPRQSGCRRPADPDA